VGLQITYSGDHLQPCAHGSLCVILVSPRIPEVDEDAVAHVLRNEATEALHRLSDTLLIGRNDPRAPPTPLSPCQDMRPPVLPKAHGGLFI
jgi:hypothetical protein